MSPTRRQALDKDDLLQMLYYLKLVRAFEERLSILHRQGKVLGGIFSGIGQEAIVVGTCYGLRREDYICPLHRDLGAFLVKGVEPKHLMAQIFGKRDGLSRGKDSYLHSGVPELGIFGNTSMLGANLPVACGLAYGFKLRRQDRVVLGYFGEGAASVGDTHEAMNFAGIHKLPVVFVCENNFYAYSVPVEKQMAIADVADRAAAYGFPGTTSYGNDLLAVFHATRQAIERARRGEGPTLIEFKTYRWHGHSEHDKAFYRSEEELLEWKSRDPIPQFETYLREKQVVNAENLGEITRRVQREIEEAVQFAEENPYPEPESALEDLYA
jgi:TPP-dependent pyruvate/acetoin dehydrogenase alpha subunit